MPVIGRADDDRVEVLALEHAAEVAGGESRRLAELLRDAVLHLRDLLVVDIAQGNALRTKAQHGSKIARALPAAADQADPDAAVRSRNLVLGRGGYGG